MKYKCLVLDHDDTVVKSTPSIHYPSFVEAMKELRPEMKPYTLEEFLEYCFHPGFFPLCKDILKFNDDEMKREHEIWQSYTGRIIPEFYEGFSEIIREFKEKGGYVCIVSHSEKIRIERDYKHNMDFEPDMIFGWEYEEKQRKPYPYPLEQIMKTFHLEKEDLLMVDDLRPGLEMARTCNVDFACAGWSHIIPEMKTYMEENADYYLREVKELRELIF